MFFTNPLFLFALFALAIPIAVHLFNFRKYKIFYFSNTQFLQTLKQQTHRHSQLRKLVILTLRLLAILSIVFAFTRPYISLQEKNNALKGNQYVLIYMDNSFSMESVSSRGTLLDEAIEKASYIVEAFAEEDRYMLVTNDFSPRNQQFFTKEEMKKEIKEVKISASTRNLPMVMEYALHFLSRQASDNKKIYLISDFQQTTASLSTMPKKENVITYLVPLKANKLTNIYVDTSWFEAPAFTVGQPVNIHLVLKNNSDEDVEKLPVKLFVNNLQKAVASADIKANGFTELQMSFTVFEKGMHNAYIEILDYPVTFDDKMYFSFYVNPFHSVYCVYGDEESAYLKALYANDSTILYQSVSDRNINYAALKNQDLIVLDRVKEQSSGFLQAIDEYVRYGGNVLYIPSPDAEITLSNVFNRRLGLPFFVSLDTQRTRVASLNMEHDLFKHVFEKFSGSINLPEVFRYYTFNKGIFPGKESLILLESNNDFLIVQKVDRGNVFLLATPLLDDYSEFQKHAIVVPALYNMAILQSKQDQSYYIIGENSRIVLNKIDLEVDNVLEILNPKTKFSFIPEIRKNSAEMNLFVHDQITEADNYLLTNNSDTISGLSFNYNRKESQMSFYDKSELEEQINRYELKNYKVLNLQNKSTNAIISEIQTTGLQLWYYFVIFALLCLLAEVILLRLWKQ